MSAALCGCVDCESCDVGLNLGAPGIGNAGPFADVQDQCYMASPGIVVEVAAGAAWVEGGGCGGAKAVVALGVGTWMVSPGDVELCLHPRTGVVVEVEVATGAAWVEGDMGYKGGCLGCGRYVHGKPWKC